VTRNPTAEWLARQITEAFPWDTTPEYLIRDNDRAFGVALRFGCEPWAFGAHLVLLALAEWVFGTLDRIDKARVHRSFDRVQRRAPSANSWEVQRLL
jgi:hypothetical protein